MMKSFRTDVVSENGVPFRVYLSPSGESENYPAANDSNGGVPMIEVYDLRYQQTPDGQFTGARYHVETFMQRSAWHPGSRGLSLYGGNEEWRLDSNTCAMLRTWIQNVLGNSVDS